MSDYTRTPNYNLYKPVPNADNDVWGDHLNSNADTLDTIIKNVENAAGVKSFNTRTGVVALTNTDVVTVLPGSSATPAMDGTAAAGTAGTWAHGDHVHPTDTTRAALVHTHVSTDITDFAEATDDRVAALLKQGANVTLTYDDAANTLTIASTASGGATLPSATTSQLYGGTGTANTAQAVTLGTNLSMSGTTLNATGGGGSGLTISATPPASPTVGQVWFDSTGGQTYVWYDDGNTTQWVPLTNQGGSGTNVGRNLIHNPLFNIAQRGAGPFNASQITMDRWNCVAASGDGMAVNRLAATDGQRAAVGDEAMSFYLQNIFTGTTANAAAQTYITQSIEGVARLAGKTVTLSFWAAASTTLKLGLNMVQVFGTGGTTPGVWANTTGTQVTATTTWTRFVCNFVIPSIAGKTVGSGGDDYTAVRIALSSAATNNQINGNIGQQSGTIQIWGVQLELGPVATPLEKPDPQQDLAKCQRFYQAVKASARFVAAGASQFLDCTVTFPPMRVEPQVAAGAADASANISSSALTTTPGVTNSARFEIVSTAAGDCYQFGRFFYLTADL